MRSDPERDAYRLGHGDALDFGLGAAPPATQKLAPAAETPSPVSANPADIGDSAAMIVDGKLVAIDVHHKAGTGLSDVDSDDDLQPKRQKRLLLPAIRKNGVIYVADDHWVKARRWAVNAHLLVASPASGVTLQKLPKGIESLIKTPTEEDVYMEISPDTLPYRFRILNLMLRADLNELLGWQRQPVNHDQVAPFRTIVPIEEDIRRRYEQLKAKFADISMRYPDHPAVARTHDNLPPGLTYRMNIHCNSPLRAEEDAIDASRILLDGYAALVHLLDTDLKGVVETYRRVQAGTIESIPFSHLWFLFQPGQEILVPRPRPQGFRVTQVTGGRRSLTKNTHPSSKQKVVSPLTIDCFQLEFDGRNFGPVTYIFQILPYEGAKAISALIAFPMSLAQLYSPKGELKPASDVLLARGRKFKDLVGVSHRRYQGLTLKDGTFEVVNEVDSEVIVDFELAYRGAATAPAFDTVFLDTPSVEAKDETWEQYGTSRADEPTWISFDDPDHIQARWTSWSHSTPLAGIHPPNELPEDGLKLLPSRVYGYVLLSRRWYPLDIDLIELVPVIQPGQKDGFEKLVLPPGHREIVRALVKTHARKLGISRPLPHQSRVQREFDLVKGKGKGLIILLHGSPGVGKTSTAECVAANAGRPLFPITCGDLGGDTAQEIEANLERYFDLARKWNCVLLLDEADVFLSARVTGNIKQNSLVSVFLRVLEYYSGILILTTNRVGAFDEAIKSRVHCALYYPPLDERQTFKIWQMNLAALEERNASMDPRLQVRFRREEIEEFARQHWRSGRKDNRWNGRQIKNAFQTAVALADWDHLEQMGGLEGEVPIGPLLRAAHFKKVVKASRHFDLYLERVRRSDYSRALADEIRDDDIRGELDSGESDEKPRRRKGRIKEAEKGKRRSFQYASESEEASQSESSENEESDESNEGDELLVRQRRGKASGKKRSRE